MPITSVSKDPTALTMTVTGEFPVPLERLWEAYADPRQLERFWGPPTWPATFYRHDMFTGGRSEYVMTGPEGETSRGFWDFIDVQPQTSFEVRDGFANDDGSENVDLPGTRSVFAFAATPDGSRVTVTTHFNRLTDLEQLLQMGMEQGMREAMAQIDAVVEDLTSFAAGRACEAQILSDTQIRVSRVIRGSVEQVWQAHHNADLMKRWMLGPDGWVMPVCQLADAPGGSYRFEWASADGTQTFGFTGEVVQSQAPHREVSTEQMIGMEGPATTNEMTLTPVAGGTLLSVVITYPSAEVRDAVLSTGMAEGMEASYARLESLGLAAA